MRELTEAYSDEINFRIITAYARPMRDDWRTDNTHGPVSAQILKDEGLMTSYGTGCWLARITGV